MLEDLDIPAINDLAEELTAPGHSRSLLLKVIAELAPEETPTAQVFDDQLIGMLIERCLKGTPQPIGIWEPRTRDGATLFQRNEKALTLPWWPPHKTLAPKRFLLPLRVCLLGESTAAGWFYAPLATPAKFLEAQLNSVKGAQLFEVLDLTMVNLQPHSLVELTAAVTQLSPDVLVIFAGNNWAVRLPALADATAADLAAAARALRADGVNGLREMAAQRTRVMAESTVAAIAKLSEVLGLTVVLVIPEVNLADWSRSRPVGWLPGDRASRWHRSHREAIHCLRAGRFEPLADLAREMRVLDGGSCSTSLELLAEAERARGNVGRARELLCRAVEARTWDNFPSVPSATSAVKSVLRRAEAYGFTTVDLPEVFAETLGGQLPGRRLFLDYCHLTLEGMRTAMAAVAEEVLRLSGPAGEPVPTWAEISRRVEIPLSPAADAQVKFVSALYGAHYGCDYDPYTGETTGWGHGVVEHWLEEARTRSATVDASLLAYARSRSAPFHSFALSAEQQQLFLSLTELEGQSAQSHGFDPEMVKLIARHLDGAQRRVHDHITEALVERHRLDRTPVDLANVVYQWSLADRHQGGGGFAPPATGIYRASWSHSNFCFVSDPQELLVDLTARLPIVEGPRRGTLALQVNGHPCAEMPLNGSWSRGVFRIRAELLSRGFNKLTLAWPDLPPCGDAAITQLAERLEVGIPVHLHPVFGELFALRIRTSREVA